jgi:hypothetical protein
VAKSWSADESRQVVADEAARRAKRQLNSPFQYHGLPLWLEGLHLPPFASKPATWKPGDVIRDDFCPNCSRTSNSGGGTATTSEMDASEEAGFGGAAVLRTVWVLGLTEMHKASELGAQSCCNMCARAIYHPTGVDQGLLRVHDQSLGFGSSSDRLIFYIDTNVLYRYSNLTDLSQQSFHDDMIRSYELHDRGSAPISRFTYRIFGQFVEIYHTLRRENPQFWKSSFECPHCGPNPDTVVIDGTNQACVRWNQLEISDPHDIFQYASHLAQKAGVSVQRGGKTSEFEDTRIIPKDVVRQRFNAIGKGERIKKDVRKQIQGLTQAQVDDMESLIRSQKSGCCEFLLPFWLFIKENHLQQDGVDGLLSVRAPFSYVFLELCKKSNAAQTIKTDESITVLQSFLSAGAGDVNIYHEWSAKMGCLQKNAPVVYDIIVKCTPSDGILPVYLGPILKRIVSIARNSFKEAYALESTRLQAPPMTFKDRMLTQNWFFPGLEVNKGPVVFAADVRYTRGEGIGEGAAGDDEDQKGCSKVFGPKHMTWSPGMFFCCCPHGILIGWMLMKEKESCKTPFEIFYYLFERAPRRIVYDNACNL